MIKKIAEIINVKVNILSNSKFQIQSKFQSQYRGAMCFIGLVCLIRVMKHRSNEDISLNNYAEQLIQLRVLNVRTKGDFQWHFAKLGYQGCSTVDLALASENIFLIQYLYVQTFTTFSHHRFIRKTLWPLFIDEVQLSQGYRATTRSPYHSVPRSSWYSFDRPRKDERLNRLWRIQWFWNRAPRFENLAP